jgi:hypothetical protein
MAYVTIEKGIITATAQNSLTDLNDLIRELTALQGKLPLVEARAIIATLNPQSEFRVIEDAILRIVTLSTAMEVPD